MNKMNQSSSCYCLKLQKQIKANYSRVTFEKKNKLIEKVLIEESSIKRAAKQLNIKLSTAKAIIQKHHIIDKQKENKLSLIVPIPIRDELIKEQTSQLSYTIHQLLQWQLNILKRNLFNQIILYHQRIY